jgi:hypothetical protein
VRRLYNQPKKTTTDKKTQQPNMSQSFSTTRPRKGVSRSVNNALRRPVARPSLCRAGVSGPDPLSSSINMHLDISLSSTSSCRTSQSSREMGHYSPRELSTQTRRPCIDTTPHIGKYSIIENANLGVQPPSNRLFILRWSIPSKTLGHDLYRQDDRVLVGTILM